MNKLNKFFNKKPQKSSKPKKQTAYICATAFTHEVGDTETYLLPHSKTSKKVQEHKNCGIYEVDVIYKKTIYKPKPFSQKNTLSPIELTENLIESTEKNLKEKKEYLKKLKKELKQLQKK